MKRVTIVGMGALGSHTLLQSRNLKVSFRCIDDDRVEAKNILSQNHTKMGQGKNKAVAIGQSMQAWFGLKVEVIPHRLVQENVGVLLAGSDLVVDCVDNAHTRRLIQGYTLKHSIPCVHSGLAADGQFGRVIWTEDFKPDEAAEGAATCEDGEHLPFISLVSACLSRVIQTFIKDGTKSNVQIWPNGAKWL